MRLFMTFKMLKPLKLSFWMVQIFSTHPMSNDHQRNRHCPRQSSGQQHCRDTAAIYGACSAVGDTLSSFGLRGACAFPTKPLSGHCRHLQNNNNHRRHVRPADEAFLRPTVRLVHPQLAVHPTQQFRVPSKNVYNTKT